MELPHIGELLAGTCCERNASAEKSLAPDSALFGDLQDAAREFARTAQSLRTLADYLERNPQSLLRGKAGDAR